MAEPPPASSPRHPTWRPNELVVDLNHLDTVAGLLAAMRAAPIDDGEQDATLELAVLRFDEDAMAGRSIGQLAGELKERAAAEWNGWTPVVGKNRTVSSVGAERVIDIGAVGAQRVIDIGGSGEARPAPQAPAARTGDAGHGVRVAVLDTGVFDHPWLTGGFRCDRTSLLPDAATGGDPAVHHGTFVAGLVLQAAPAAEVVVVKVLQESGTGDSWQVARVLGQLALAGADVVNLSLACFTDDDQPPLILQRAVDCFGRDSVVVAAAGNYRSRGGVTPRPSWPAALQNVVAVGSTDDAEVRHDSSFSPAAPWVDARARGRDLTSSYGAGGEFRTWSGTSFASAHTTGAIAREAADRRLSAGDVWRQVATGALKLPDVRPGH